MKYHFLFLMSCAAVALGVGVENLTDVSDAETSAKLGSQSGFEQILGLNTQEAHASLFDDTLDQGVVLTEVVQLRGTLPVMPFDETLSDW